MPALRAKEFDMKILKSDIYAKQKFKAGDLVRVVGKRPVGRITYMPASYNKKSIEFRSPNGNFSLIMDIPIDLLEKADKRDRFIFELDLIRH